jgi:hypothetical protein
MGIILHNLLNMKERDVPFHVVLLHELGVESHRIIEFRLLFKWVGVVALWLMTLDLSRQ